MVLLLITLKNGLYGQMLGKILVHFFQNMLVMLIGLHVGLFESIISFFDAL